VGSVRHQRGWAIAQAVPRDQHTVDAGAVRADPLTEGQPLLVVVDYSERGRAGALRQLMAMLSSDYPGRRIRALMLARQGELVWATMAAELDGIGVDKDGAIGLLEPIALGDFTSDRSVAFADAVTAFATRIGAPHRQQPAVPPDLTGDAYTSPLTLHMAAL